MTRNGCADGKWNIHEVLVVACAYNRIYGYLSTQNGRKRWSSEDMLRCTFMPSFYPSDFLTKPEITPEDIEESKRIISHFSYLLMDAMTGTLNNVTTRILELTNLEDVYETDFALVARLPSLYRKENATLQFTSLIRKSSNGFVGNEGDRVLLSVKIVKVSYSCKLNCFVHEAITKVNGRYITFFSTVQVASEANECNLIGTVKKHKQHNEYNALETQLSNVKIIDFL